MQSVPFGQSRLCFITARVTANISIAIRDIASLDQRIHAIQQYWVIPGPVLRYATFKLPNTPKGTYWPLSSVQDWITEHIQEKSPRHAIEFLDGQTPFPPQIVGLVENCCYLLLHAKRRERKSKAAESRSVYTSLCRASDIA
jgi:hypothetical protein